MPHRPSPQHDRHRSRARWRGGLSTTLLAGLLAAGGATAWASPEPTPLPGPATTTLPGTLLEGGYADEGTTTLLAYAAAGDEVVARIATTASTPAGARVVVTDPTGVVVHDGVAPGAAANVRLGGAWTSTHDGVWSIAIVDPHVGTGGEAAFAWEIAVLQGGASIPGRVWTESLAIHTDDVTSIVLHAAAPDGAVYRVALDGYDGVDSTLRMNDVGNARAGTCEPAMRSVPMPSSPEAGGLGADYWQPDGDDCAGLSAYRLFLDPPAADLPAATDAWADGRADDTWLSSTYVAPTIDELGFARDAAAANAGTLTGTLAGQPGVVRVEVDADGDGAFDGPGDVVDELAVLEPGAFAWAWDGLDAAGSPVPVTRAGVTMRASMAQVSPLHFLRIDAETSTGGIEVETRTGPEPGIASLHWDDTSFDSSSGERWSRTAALLGSDPATTSAGGVHGWEAGGPHPNQNDGVHGSWGDLRSIDDWAFIEDHAEATIAVPPLPDLRIDKRVDDEVVAAADGSAVDVRWTIEVANLASATATATVVQDAYPEALRSGSVIAELPTQGSFDPASGTWTVGDLAGGAHATLTFQGRIEVAPGTAATVVNGATVANPNSPAAEGSCRPNDGVEADDDRCDRVETRLTPVEPTASSSPPATTAPPRASSSLPRTGAETAAGIIAVAGAIAVALGCLGVALHRRRARR